ncbi:ribosome maturation factor RimM [Geoalkalibacter sp.]|uniref:ribosome maturation factor RimM n=1 Tax=Geoalkalibacter sp. TaxID=3041440 RepID=UPI00272DF983|nr:ribosome maturation factor RimM [Geoalkalibacter sp.]
MGDADQELFQAGVVVGTHGLRGDLKVRPLTPGSTVLLDTRTVHLGRDGQEDLATYQVRRAVAHKGLVLLRLEGRESIEAAAPLKGSKVFMPLAELPDLEDDESYWYELQGAEVIDRRLGLLGILEDLFVTAAHDVYVVRGRFGEVLIPAVDEFILEFDEEQGRLLVDLPFGLVDEGTEIQE